MSDTEATPVVPRASFLARRFEAADVDAVVGVQERMVQEWLAHIMNELTEMKEENTKLRDKIVTLEAANGLARDRIRELTREKAQKDGLEAQKLLLKSTRTELATLETQVNTLEDPDVDGSLANRIAKMERTGPSTSQAGGTAGPYIKPVKFEKPALFENKKGDDIKYWLRGLELYLRNYPHERVQSLIEISRQFLQGNAKFVGDNILQDLEKGTPGYTASWSAFKAHLIQMFADPNERIKATEELRGLKYRRSEDVHEFVDKFKTLAAKSGLTGPPLIDLLVGKFPHDVANAVAFSAVGLSDNWLEWVEALEKAQVHQQTVYHQQHGYGTDTRKKTSSSTGTNPTQNTSRSGGSYQNTATTKDPNAMDVDRTKAMKEGLCFRCKQKGHLARNCPGNQGAMIRAVDATPAQTNTAQITEVPDFPETS